MAKKTEITKQPHPDFPSLKYRYECSERGLVGYSHTKKEAERNLRLIKSRKKTTANVSPFKL